MDTISVIMPCFNAEAHILRGVSSALEQSFDNVELIVVNDGSTDRSLEILQQVKDHRLRIIDHSNRGVGAARNRGLEESSGEYLAFLDTDDSWHPNCLEILHDKLKSYPSAKLAYCGWQNIGLPGGRGEPYIPPEYEGPEKWEKLLRACPWPIHAALVRREVVFEAGCFKEGLAHAEDYRLWLNIAASGFIVRVPEVLAYYHFHGGIQATDNMALEAKNDWKVKREFLRRFPQIAGRLNRKKKRDLVEGMMLRRGYELYWKRDLEEARKIFHMVMKTGYGSLKDWKYMLPSVLPSSIHRILIRSLERDNGSRFFIR
jgi:glycosyltransferase involved in cell wall biosynthesis